MRNNPFAQALGPVAARIPKTVREHEVLRLAAEILGKDKAKGAQSARSEVLKWAERRSGGRLPQEAWGFQSFEHFSGGRNSIGVRIESGQLDIWAIRADDPDKTVPGRIWTTEVVVGLTGDLPARFSARLLVSTNEDNLDIEPHTPGFVQQVAATCGLSRGSIQIDAEPWLIKSDDEADSLVELLIDEYRELPIFVLTVPEDSRDAKQPLIDATGLARATLGTAQVVVVPADFTWALTEGFGKQRSVYGGAVRAYLPGFTEDANPYSHRLVLAEHIATPSGEEKCFRWMQSLAAIESVRRTPLGGNVVAFAEVRNVGLRLTQQRLEREGASDSEQLKAANARIEALEKQTEEQKSTLDYFDSEHRRAEERADAAERQLNASAFRIQQLLDQLKARGEAPDANIGLPTTWAELTDWCDDHLAGRVVLTTLAQRNARSPAFSDVQLAAGCLLWLANECRERRMSGGEGSLREETVEDGIRNAHCGNDQFNLDWQGQRCAVDWHIKNGGNTRDPTRCLRIYYFWDPATRQIVVADMPAHRKTGAS